MPESHPRLLPWLSLLMRGFRKRFASFFLAVAVVVGGVSGWAAVAEKAALLWMTSTAAAASAAVSVVAARPKAIGLMRVSPRDGTIWQDYEGGITLITRRDGRWSVGGRQGG